MEQKKGTHAIILGLTDTGETIPAASGRISTQPGTASEIFQKSLGNEKNADLIQKVTKSGHNSTVEHTVFNIAFEDVSVFAEQFLIEFRLASFTVKSRRYVDFSDCGYFIPSTLSEEQMKIYRNSCDALFACYQELVDAGVPREDARFVLPYCLHSNFYCSVNARELLHMLSELLYGRGAKFPELYALGQEILEQIKRKTPGILQNFLQDGSKLPEKPFPLTPSVLKEKAEKSVSLLSYTENATELICQTALLAQGFSFSEAKKLAKDKQKQEELLAYLLSSSRPRALETAVYTFSIPGISLACLTHFARHRMQSIQIPSLCRANRKEYVLPTSIQSQPILLESYKKAFRTAETLSEKLLSSGIAKEDLVYTLLSGNTIDITTTMNARELLLFFKLRCCNRAQWEIREKANQMLKLCREKEPALFSRFGPSCYVSYCPEGRMTCGKADQIKKIYSPQFRNL